MRLPFGVGFGAGTLGLGDDFLFEVFGEEVVVAELHVIAAPALCQSGEGIGELEHLSHGDFGFDDGRRAL